VPAIIYWPGVAAPGSVCRQPAWMPDVTATFCAAAGVSAPDDRPFDGVDLRPALRGETLSRPDPLFWQFPYRGVGLRDGSSATSPPLALRDGSWKMLCNEDFTGVELYNLEVDRSEQWNMQKEYPEVTARLLAAMRRMQKSVNTVPPEGIDNLSPAMQLPDGKKAADYPRYAPPGT
jgi:arylsulfatase A-like enzyme